MSRRATFARHPAVAALVAMAPLALFAAATGCTPNIGDKCVQSTDCSIQGNRVCDTSQPNGYCTVFDCSPNSCPGNSACVEFRASVPGCPYDDYSSPARTGRALCVATCASDSDCRGAEGYACGDPQQPPWNAIVIDKNHAQRVCMVASSANAAQPATFADPGVCSPTRVDAGSITVVSVVDGGGDAGIDGDAARPSDASDASDAADVANVVDAASEGGADGSDASADGPTDATFERGSDSSPVDSSGGG